MEALFRTQDQDLDVLKEVDDKLLKVITILSYNIYVNSILGLVKMTALA